MIFLIFCSCAEHDVVVLKESLALFSEATGMIINEEKYHLPGGCSGSSPSLI
jgi:hypothetical protein